MIANTFQNRVLGKALFGAAMLTCALWGAAGARDGAALPTAIPSAFELPRRWQGTAVRPLALSAVAGSEAIQPRAPMRVKD